MIFPLDRLFSFLPLAIPGVGENASTALNADGTTTAQPNFSSVLAGLLNTTDVPQENVVNTLLNSASNATTPDLNLLDLASSTVESDIIATSTATTSTNLTNDVNIELPLEVLTNPVLASFDARSAGLENVASSTVESGNLEEEDPTAINLSGNPLAAVLPNIPLPPVEQTAISSATNAVSSNGQVQATSGFGETDVSSQQQANALLQTSSTASTSLFAVNARINDGLSRDIAGTSTRSTTTPQQTQLGTALTVKPSSATTPQQLEASGVNQSQITSVGLSDTTAASISNSTNGTAPTTTSTVAFNVNRDDTLNSINTNDSTATRGNLNLLTGGRTLSQPTLVPAVPVITTPITTAAELSTRPFFSPTGIDRPTEAIQTLDISKLMVDINRRSFQEIAEQPDVINRSDLINLPVPSATDGNLRFENLLNNLNRGTSADVTNQLGDELLQRADQLVKPGTHEIRLRLDPPELGTINIRVQSNGNDLRADITAVDPNVRAMLQSQISELRDRLEQAGLNFSSFDLNSGDQFNRQSRQNETADTDETPRRPVQQRNTNNTPKQPVNAARDGSMLDVTV